LFIDKDAGKPPIGIGAETDVRNKDDTLGQTLRAVDGHDGGGVLCGIEQGGFGYGRGGRDLPGELAGDGGGRRLRTALVFAEPVEYLA